MNRIPRRFGALYLYLIACLWPIYAVAQGPIVVVTGGGFRPASQVLYANDFSQEPIGNFPRSLKYVRGPLEVVQVNGVPMLRSTGNGEFIIPLTGPLPQDFTLEFDFVSRNSDCCAGEELAFEGSPQLNRSSGSAWVAWHHQGVGILGGGYDYGTSTVRFSEELQGELKGQLGQIRVMMSGTSFKLWTNGRQTYNIPDLVFRRTNLLRVFLGGVDDADRAVYLARVRLATGALMPGGVASNPPSPPPGVPAPPAGSGQPAPPPGTTSYVPPVPPGGPAPAGAAPAGPRPLVPAPPAGTAPAGPRPLVPAPPAGNPPPGQRPLVPAPPTGAAPSGTGPTVPGVPAQAPPPPPPVTAMPAAPPTASATPMAPPSTPVIRPPAVSPTAPPPRAGGALTTPGPATLLGVARQGWGVNLRWNKIAGASGYQIDRSDPGSAFMMFAGVDAASSPLADDERGEDVTVLPGSAYQYRVSARFATGPASGYSPIAIFTAPSQLPQISNLTAIVGVLQLALFPDLTTRPGHAVTWSWTPIPGVGTYELGIDLFVVDQLTGQQTVTNFSRVTIPATSAPSYTTPVEVGKKVWFCVSIIRAARKTTPVPYGVCRQTDVP